jgi:hypothetical protein
MEETMVDAEDGQPGGHAPDEWTTGERKRIEALPRERAATPALEHRTIVALQASGLLAGNARESGLLTDDAQTSGLLTDNARPRGRRVLMLAIAASALFAAGAGAGYLAAMRAVEVREAAREAARPSNEGGAGAPVLGARAETLAAQNPGGRHITWY